MTARVDDDSPSVARNLKTTALAVVVGAVTFLVSSAFLGEGRLGHLGFAVLMAILVISLRF